MIKENKIINDKNNAKMERERGEIKNTYKRKYLYNCSQRYLYHERLKNV